MAQPPVPGRDAGAEPGRDRGLPGGTPGAARTPGPQLRLGDFTQGRAGDACPPGPDLAAVLDRLCGPDRRCAGATDDELIGLLGRWAAVGSWAAAGMLGVIAELIRRRALPGHEDRAPGGMPTAWHEGLGHELAQALAVSLPGADKLAALAWALPARLPGIGARLADGTITEVKARIAADELSVLDSDLAARAEALIVDELAGKTPGQIARLAAAAVLAVDPEGAQKRREQAERDNARVRFWREQAGTAALAGFGLPTDAALAANANIDVRARQYKKAKLDGTMGQLRVLAYLDILNGITADQRIAQARAASQSQARDGQPQAGQARPARAQAGPAGGAAPGDSGGPAGSAAPDGTMPGHQDGPEDGRQDSPEDGRQDSPADGAAGAGADAPGTDDSADGGGPADDRSADGGPADDGPADDGPADDGPADDGPAYEWLTDNGPWDDEDDDDGSCDDGDDDADLGADGAGDDEPGTGPGRGPGAGDGPGGGSGPGGSGGSGGGPGRGDGPGGGPGDAPDAGDARDAGDAGPALAAATNLTIPLATVQGLADRPGHGHGLGPLDPALARDLAAAAARSPHSTFCVTVTSPQGYAIGHGCARPAKGSRDKSSRGKAPSGGRASPWSFTRTGDPGPPGGYGTWTLTLPGGRAYTVRLAPIPVTDCDHQHESRGYQPGGTLRHLVQVRDGTCTFPACSRHARYCDFEHAQPYDQGGRTCGCNAGARSRRCHKVKQSPGWSVTQPLPGWHRWTTPSGRTYTQGPMKYPA